MPFCRGSAAHSHELEPPTPCRLIPAAHGMARATGDSGLASGRRAQPVVGRLGVRYEVEAVAEGIRERGEPPQVRVVEAALQARACLYGALHRGVEIVDDEVEVDRRPVAREVLAQHVLARFELGLRACEQVDGNPSAPELDPPRGEAARQGEPAAVDVELDPALEVVDLDVDVDLGHARDRTGMPTDERSSLSP